MPSAADQLRQIKEELSAELGSVVSNALLTQIPQLTSGDDFKQQIDEVVKTTIQSSLDVSQIISNEEFQKRIDDVLKGVTYYMLRG